MIIDLHVRTDATEAGGHSPARIIEVAKEAGIDGVAFVERLKSSHARALIAAGEAADFPVFVGVEIPATLGSFLCFAPEIEPFMSREEWLQLMAVPITPSAERVIELFESVGGAVIAAQPFRREHNGSRLGDSLALCEGIHGVEVVTPGDAEMDVILATEATVRLGLPLVGGSCLSQQIGNIGHAATLFAHPIKTQREFVDALREGNFWALSTQDAFSEPRARPPRSDDSSDGRRQGSRSRGDRSSRDRSSRDRSSGGQRSRGPRRERR